MSSKWQGALRTLFSTSTPKNYGPGIGGTLKNIGHTGLELVREGTFGSPVNLAQELSARNKQLGGWHKALGSQLKNYYWRSPGPEGGSLGHYLSNAISLGLPAHSLYSAATSSSPEDRNANLASAGVGLVTAPILGRLGVAGNIAQGILQNKVHNLFRPSQNTSPYNMPGHIEQTFRSHAAAQAANDDLGVQDGYNV